MVRTCLIGEADPFIARLLQRFSEERGLSPVCIRMGQELPEQARLLDPAVIILDAELPGDVRGWEAARALAVDPALRHIPLIVCSWLDEADALALIAGAAGHLQKPDLHYEDFVAALEEAGVRPGLVSSLDEEGPGEVDPP